MTQQLLPRNILTIEGEWCGQAQQGNVIAVLLTIGVHKGPVPTMVHNAGHIHLQPPSGLLRYGTHEHLPAAHHAIPPAKQTQKGKVGQQLGSVGLWI